MKKISLNFLISNNKILKLKIKNKFIKKIIKKLNKKITYIKNLKKIKK